MSHAHPPVPPHSLPPTPQRNGASELLLWALALGPCPVEPETDTFSEARARRLAERIREFEGGVSAAALRRRGIAIAAAWLTSPTAPEPGERLPQLETTALPARDQEAARHAAP